MGKKEVKKNNNVVYMLIGVILVSVAGYWFFNGAQNQSQYANLVAGTMLKNPSVSANGIVTVSTQIAEDKKLLFIDLKLSTPQTQFTYNGRIIPLSMYQNGGYLPLLLIYSPSGGVIGGIRACEPCGSFSFHIVDGKYLECDLCHTRWDVETLKGVSGGCVNFPPPTLKTTVDNGINIDISSLNLKLQS
jgi:hypothetical protein